MEINEKQVWDAKYNVLVTLKIDIQTLKGNTILFYLWWSCFLLLPTIIFITSLYER